MHGWLLVAEPAEGLLQAGMGQALTGGERGLGMVQGFWVQGAPTVVRPHNSSACCLGLLSSAAPGKPWRQGWIMGWVRV